MAPKQVCQQSRPASSSALAPSIVAHHVTRAGRKHLARSCWEFVGSCREFVGSCRELSGVVVGRDLSGVCRDLSGGIGNVDFMESHFEGIAIVFYKISAEFPIPEILRSVPVEAKVESITQQRNIGNALA